MPRLLHTAIGGDGNSGTSIARCRGSTPLLPTNLPGHRIEVSSPLFQSGDEGALPSGPTILSASDCNWIDIWNLKFWFCGFESHLADHAELKGIGIPFCFKNKSLGVRLPHSAPFSRRLTVNPLIYNQFSPRCGRDLGANPGGRTICL